MKTDNRSFRVQTYLTFEEKRQLEKHIKENDTSEARTLRIALKNFFAKAKRKTNAKETK